MRTLVVYYSRTGTTRKVAESISHELGSDMEEITENRGRSGIFGFLRSGMEAYTRRIPKINKATHDPTQYDLVLIGSPVWSYNMSSPVRAYIVQNRQGFKAVGFFVTSSNSDVSPKVFSELESQTRLIAF